VVVDAPDLLGSIKPAEKISVLPEAGGLKLGAHALSLPIGSFGAKGLDLFSTDTLLKTGLKIALKQVIKCGTIAENVSSKCIGPICVGHEAEIAGLCDRGLDVVVNLTVAGLKKLNIDPLSLVGVDAIVPGGDTLSGVWNGTIDLGKGAQVIPSPFKGKKLPF